MRGQRVVIKAERPQGDFDFPINLKGTKGVIIREILSDTIDGALILCEADDCIWAFKPSEYEVISEEDS